MLNHAISFKGYTRGDDKIPSDDENLEITGYNLVKDDHLSNSIRGGVCVYYKTSLPFRVINVKDLQ